MTDTDTDTLLALDPDFAAVCDARRDAWIADMEAEAAAESDYDRLALAVVDAEAESDRLTLAAMSGDPRDVAAARTAWRRVDDLREALALAAEACQS